MIDTHHELTYLQAIIEAQREEMLRDERVILIGENIDIYGCALLFDSFDERRLRNVPISENSFTGMGVGAALTGLRPIVDLTIASFLYLASDQIINQAAKLRYMTGGQLRVPIVFRACTYYNVGNACPACGSALSTLHECARIEDRGAVHTRRHERLHEVRHP